VLLFRLGSSASFHISPPQLNRSRLQEESLRAESRSLKEHLSAAADAQGDLLGRLKSQERRLREAQGRVRL
jgi:hypothetical protein